MTAGVFQEWVQIDRFIDLAEVVVGEHLARPLQQLLQLGLDQVLAGTSSE